MIYFDIGIRMCVRLPKRHAKAYDLPWINSVKSNCSFHLNNVNFICIRFTNNLQCHTLLGCMFCVTQLVLCHQSRPLVWCHCLVSVASIRARQWWIGFNRWSQCHEDDGRSLTYLSSRAVLASFTRARIVDMLAQLSKSILRVGISFYIQRYWIQYCVIWCIFIAKS